MDQQIQASRELTELTSRANTNRARAELAGAGINPAGLGEAAKPVELSNRAIQALQADTSKLIQAGNDQAGSLLAGIVGAQEAQTQGSENIKGSVDSLGAGFTNLDGSLNNGFGQTLAATQAQTAELAQQLAGLQAAVNQLPGAIAASLPRPAPPARPK